MRHVIIGNSAAGVFAADAIRSIDRDCDITMVSDEDCPCYSRCLLPYYIAGELSRQELFIKDSKWYEERAIRTLFGKRAVSVDECARKVVLDDGERVPYDSLLVGTGSSARLPEVEGVDNRMVSGLRRVEDALAILEFLPEVQRAVVVGGGLIGLKSAYALWKRGVRVTIVEMLEQILAGVLDEAAARMIEGILQIKNIGLRTGCTVVEIAGTQGRVGSVRLNGGERLKCDLVISAVGVKPNTELVEGTRIDKDEGILVDRYMRTSVPGVYAAGDVAETLDALSGQRRVNAIWPSAAREGRVAGSNMAGVARRCDSELVMNSLDFFDIPVVSIGLVDAKADECEVVTAGSAEKNVYRKLVLKDNRIVGILLLGDVERAGVILSLMKREDDVSLVRSAFLEGEVLKRSPAMKAFGQVLHYPQMMR